MTFSNDSIPNVIAKAVGLPDTNAANRVSTYANLVPLIASPDWQKSASIDTLTTPLMQHQIAVIVNQGNYTARL